MRVRVERVLVVLGICLPVPVFAATGLAIPLPASVERLAVALVPWADAASLDANQTLMRGARGLIVLERSELAATPGELVLAPEERAPDRTRAGETSAPAGKPSDRSTPSSVEGSPPGDRPAPVTGADQAAAPDSASSVDSADEPNPEPRSPTPTPAPDPGGTEPSRDPSPVDEAVEKVGEAPKTIVDEVGTAVDPALAPVEEVVPDLSPVVDDVVPGGVPRIGK